MPHVRARPDLPIHYVEAGSGSPLLLLAGLGATVASWGRLLPRLAERHRCIAVDNRGSGGSGIPHHGFGIADMADDACAVLDHLGVGSAHVLGNSLGGMIAQSLAIRRPDRVRSLVLASSGPGVVAVPSHPLVPWHLAAAQRAGGERRRWHVAAVFHGPATAIDHPERLAPGFEAAAFPAGPGTRMQLGAALRWSSLSRLRRITAPTLVLHGTHDRLSPPLNAHLLARLIPNARLHLLDRCGHFFITDAGDEAAEVIRGFTAEPLTVTLRAGAVRRAALGAAPLPG